MTINNTVSNLSPPQGSPGRHLQDSGQHDQGKNSRGDPQDVQHQERLHSQRGGAGPQGE